MPHHKIEFDEECKSCKGTGIYSGIGESQTCAVVCHTCNGTGCHHFVYEYDDFTKRKDNPKIEHVYEVNSGIKVGNGNGYKFTDFGGMSYGDWKSGKQFKPGMENRKYTCPAWWYQNTNYKLKPNWDDDERKCGCWGSSFSSCMFFKEKDGCWEKWDREFYQSTHSERYPTIEDHIKVIREHYN